MKNKFVVVVCGIIFLAIGIFLFIRNNNLVKNCTVEAQATIVDIEEEFTADSDGSSYMYYPIIEYTVNERTNKVKMDQGSSMVTYQIGQKITILYNPNKTTQFIVKGDKTSSIFSYVFIGLGAVLTVYGVVILFKKD